jgi:hypothetical protein
VFNQNKMLIKIDHVDIIRSFITNYQQSVVWSHSFGTFPGSLQNPKTRDTDPYHGMDED